MFKAVEGADNWLASAFIGLLVVAISLTKFRNHIIFYFKYAFYFLYLSCISIIGLPFALLRPLNCRTMWVYSMLLEPASMVEGIEWEIRGDKYLIEDNTSAVFACNHQTMFDIQGMLHLWHKKSIEAAAIARNLFFWIWPVGLAMWLGGTVFIRRVSGSENTIKLFNEAAKTIFKQKCKLWVYVEGTRNKNPERLLPFKKGAFRIAIEHQVPVQPVVMSPYYFLDRKNKIFGSGKVVIEILEPIETKGLTMNDLDTLIEKAYAIMSAKHKELWNEMVGANAVQCNGKSAKKNFI